MLRLASALAPTAIRALGSTVRLQIVGGERFDELRRQGAFLLVVWHGRMLLPIFHHRDLGIAGMVSLSRDGDHTARVLRGLGYSSVRGSSSKGGKEAFHALQDRLSEGAMGAIIPDGPRGPTRELKPGVLRLAHQAGVPILPLSSSAFPARRLASWDRFLLPVPFARGVVVYGEPVEAPREQSTQCIEPMRRHLERTLTELEDRADAVIAARSGEEPARDRPV